MKIQLRESQIEDSILKYLGTVALGMGLSFWKIKASGQPVMVYGKLLLKKSHIPGFSDILICIHGHMLCVEVKSADGRQQEIQKIFEDKVLRGGGIYWLIRDLGDFIERLEGLWRVINHKQKSEQSQI